MRRMKKERFQLITYQETIDYQLQCMLLPLQFKLDMLELRGRSWTSRQSDYVFHQRRENSFTSRNKAQRPKQQNTCLLCRCSYRKKRKAVDNQRRRVSQLRANSRGAGETHRCFAGSFTVVLSVLTCTAWTGVAVACTLTDSLYKSLELSTGHKHLQASIRSCTKDFFPSSGL